MNRKTCVVRGVALSGLLMLCACGNASAPQAAGTSSPDAPAEPVVSADWGRAIGVPPGVAVKIMARVWREDVPVQGDAEFLFASVDADGRVHFADPPAPQPIDTAIGYHFATGEYAGECDGGKGPMLDNPDARAEAVLLEAVAEDGRRWSVIGANRVEYAQWRNGNGDGEIAQGDSQLHVYSVNASARIQGRCDMGSFGFSEADLQLAPGWNLVRSTVRDAGQYTEGGPYLRGVMHENAERIPAGMAWFLLEIPRE